MRKILLSSAALAALLMAAPAFAQHHDNNGDSTPDTTTTPSAKPDTATDNPMPLSGHTARDHAGTPPPPPPPPPPHAPATIPGTPLLAPGAGTHGTGHDNSGTPSGNTGHGDTNTGRDSGHANTHDTSGSGTGGTMGGSNPSGRSGFTHAGRGHNSAFDALRRVFNAPHHYRHGSYHRPSGWYAHRWNYGEFLPSLFFARDYWITDYSDFDLSDPPPGTVWVRYGDDALLIDEDSGEVIQVVYGIFY